MTKLFGWVWLTVTLSFNSSAISKVLYKFTPIGAYNATEEELIFAGVPSDIAHKLSDKSSERAENIIKKCKETGISIIPSVSPHYPRALERLSDKPHVLYVRGDIGCLDGKKTAAFIGTRRMSPTGEEQAEKIASGMLNKGYVLVSGIADGIDSVAAKESLKRGLPTVAVLGVDIDKYFPAMNMKLIDKVAEQGAVISEYPPDTGARFFPARNRIIVGLSDIVTVIEAPAKSGALIGGKLALRNKIPTYALALEGKSFDGCRQLIELGATPLNPIGIRAEVKKSTPKPVEKEVTKRTKKESNKGKIPESIQGASLFIWKKLMDGPKNDSELMDGTYPVPQILCALTELELDGYIRVLPGSKYALK